jgi:hypothetical protein
MDNRGAIFSPYRIVLFTKPCVFVFATEQSKKRQKNYCLIVHKLPLTVGYLQWLAFENVFVHRDQT